MSSLIRKLAIGVIQTLVIYVLFSLVRSGLCVRVRQCSGRTDWSGFMAMSKRSLVTSLLFMRRFTRTRRYRRSIAGPYSREGTRFAGQLTVAGNFQAYYTIVPPIETQGNRKVKNIMLHIGLRSLTYPICYTLYYLPQNTPPTGFLGATGSTWDPQNNTWIGNWSSTYDPNQNVLSSGIVSLEQVTRVYWSGLRTLNSGDRIVLALHNLLPDTLSDEDGACVIDARYSIAYS